MMLAASLRGVCEVELLDLRSISNPQRWRNEISGEYLKPLLYGGEKITRHLIGDYRSRIAATSGDVYVLTANFTAEANAVAEIIRTIRIKWPRAIVLVGGRDASAPERQGFYRAAGADFVGVGDGDTTLPKFISRLHSGAGISEEYAGRLITGGITRFFRPQEHDLNLQGLDLSRYTESGGGPIHPGVLGKGFAAYVETSRGCPRECEYCTEAKSSRWVHSVEEIIRHLDHYIEAGCRLLMVSDDNLLVRREDDLIAIFRHLRDREVAWEFPVGLEVGLLTERTGVLKQKLFDALFWNHQERNQFAGAHRLLFPLEDSLLRETNLRKLKRMSGKTGGLIIKLLEQGIPFLNVAIMIGSPHETAADRERLEQNLEILSEAAHGYATRLNYSVFCTSPLPGTPFGAAVTTSGRLSHSIEDAPELWTVFASVIDGDTYSAIETTRYRRELLERFNMEQADGKVNPPE
ncbi:MAG: hypothetical protein Q7S24_01525 [bacterium]|nr:hypothetical protein [bacterium]